MEKDKKKKKMDPKKMKIQNGDTRPNKRTPNKKNRRRAQKKLT